MASTLAWLDYSDRERRQILDFVDTLKDRGTPDKLGLGLAAAIGMPDRGGRVRGPAVKGRRWQATVVPGIYLRDGEAYIAMRETPYDAEDVLQELIEHHPELLAGEDAPYGPLVLVRREAAVTDSEVGAARWSLDHLYLDARGVPTLVEVKRSSDTRVRREVVAQMLEYAANAKISFDAEQMAEWLEESAGQRGTTAAEALQNAFDLDDLEAFWQSVDTNLTAERFRLVFVSDSIPAELRRIIEYLNSQMTQTEVLAIEVKQYTDPDGAHQTVVPRVIGQTAQAEVAKGRPPKRQWDWQTWLEALSERRQGDEARAARELYDWTLERGWSQTFGAGQDGFWAPIFYVGGRTYSPVGLYTSGKARLLFRMWGNPPFNDEQTRLELLRRVNEIPGIAFDPLVAIESPAIEFRLELLAENVAAFEELRRVLEWIEAKATGTV